LIIGLMRHIAEEDANVRAGGWQRTIGPTLASATLGCLGLGNLGSQVAKVGKAFGMDVIAWSQNLTAERAADVGARLVTKEELFSQSDVVTVHLVLGDRTRGLVGAPEFALMKPTAYFVNTSRGPIVDEAALIDVLRSKRIAGAALDVFNVEPLPADHPLRSLPNTLITPHLGYVTDEGYDIFYRDAVEDILAWLAGSPVRQLA
jgi:phosphoglycerate dehydrogenase-like enzyme